MASENAETIKEFLVSLGFKVDDASGKKFSNSITGATKDVVKFGAAITGALAVADIFVTKIAENMDKLYFASKRVGSSIAEMNAFSYAVTQLGGSAEGAQNAIEGIAAFQRNTPGGAGILERMFGVKPEHLGDAVKQLEDMAPALRAMPFFQARAFTQQLGFGIDDKTLLALVNGDFVRMEKRRADLLKEMGVDQGKLADSNRVYNQSLSDTETAWGQISLILENKMLPFMQRLTEWSIQFAKNIAQDPSDKLQKDMQYDGFWDYLKKRGTGGALFDAASRGFPVLGGAVASGFEKIFGGDEIAPSVTASTGTPASPPIASSGTGTRGIRNNNPGNMVYGPFARDHGATGSDNKGFAVFPNAAAGIAAMASLLVKYGQQGNDTINGIISKWTSGDAPDIQESYKALVSRFTGTGIADHLNQGSNPDMLSKLMNAIIYNENAGKNPYSATLINQAAGLRGISSGLGTSGNNATVTQNNNLTITASLDNAQDIVTKAAQALFPMTSELVRNLKGVF